MHILSLVSDNYSSWINERGRMVVEIFSWPSLHKRMCRTCWSNSGPLTCQADMLPIELPLLLFCMWQWQSGSHHFPLYTCTSFTCSSHDISLHSGQREWWLTTQNTHQSEPRQANLCLRAFRHDKFQLRMPSHSEGPGIWFSVWRFLLIHCLYEGAAKVLARLRRCADSPEPSQLA